MKKYLLLLLGCVALFTSVIIWGLDDPAPSDSLPRKRVALVLTQDTGTYILKLKSGAQDAATDNQVELSVFVADGEMPAQVLTGGYAAVILTEDSKIELSTARKALGDTPLVTIGGADSELAVKPDPAKDGQGAAEALDVAEGAKVVLLYDPREPLRLEGAMAALPGRECHALPYAPDNGFWERIMQLSPDALIALTEEATLAAVSAKQEGLLNPRLPLSGFAQGDSVMEFLTSGQLTAATAPMPYAIGYRAVTAALDRESATVQRRTITLETLFDAENVSIVFPLLI